MSVTTPASNPDHVKQIWSNLFTDEFREMHPLVQLLDKTYRGEFGQGNDTVRISEYLAGEGELLNIDTSNDANMEACEFNPEPVSTRFIDLKIEKRAVSSREFCDLTDLLSQISSSDPKLRETMAFEVSRRVNDYLYGKVDTSSSSPDHVLGGTAAFTAGVLTSLGELANDANWPENDRWVLVDSNYYKDLLDATTLTSTDSGNTDLPIIAGRFVQQRFGWNIVLDNSRGLRTLNTTPGNPGVALAFNPEFMHWADLGGAQFKDSDQHSARKFGHVMSTHVDIGAAMGNGGDEKNILVKTGA